MAIGGNVRAVVAHRQFGWIATLCEHEIQIIKVPQVKVIASIDLRDETYGEGHPASSEEISNYKKMEWHPTLPKLIASPNSIGTGGTIYHIATLW